MVKTGWWGEIKSPCDGVIDVLASRAGAIVSENDITSITIHRIRCKFENVKFIFTWVVGGVRIRVLI